MYRESARRVAATAIVVVWLAARPAAQSFAVSAEIVPGCQVSGTGATTGLDFGTLDLGSLPATSVGVVEASGATPLGGLVIECTAGLTLSLAVDAGANAGDGWRHLAHANGSRIAYGLFTDDGQATSIPLAGSIGLTVPPSGLLDIPLHVSAILDGIDQWPGIYGDTLAITLTW